MKLVHNTRKKDKPEKNSGVVVTIPDQSLSVKEIVSRQSKGLPLPNMATTYFDAQDGKEHVNMKKMDLSEIYEQKLHVEETAKKLAAKDKREKELIAKQNELKLKEKWENELKNKSQD